MMILVLLILWFRFFFYILKFLFSVIRLFKLLHKWLYNYRNYLLVHRKGNEWDFNPRLKTYTHKKQMTPSESATKRFHATGSYPGLRGSSWNFSPRESRASHDYATTRFSRLPPSLSLMLMRRKISRQTSRTSLSDSLFHIKLLLTL